MSIKKIFLLAYFGITAAITSITLLSIDLSMLAERTHNRDFMPWIGFAEIFAALGMVWIFPSLLMSYLMSCDLHKSKRPTPKIYWIVLSYWFYYLLLGVFCFIQNNYPFLFDYDWITFWGFIIVSFFYFAQSILCSWAFWKTWKNPE